MQPPLRGCFFTGSSSVATYMTMERSFLSVRINKDNPRHHLWRNRNLWWLHATIHIRGHKKVRIRRSLGTPVLGVAQNYRDRLLGTGNLSELIGV